MVVNPFLFLKLLSIAFGLANLNSVTAWRITNNASDVAGKAFGYIIVGGGTAGLTLANRLTENPNVTVLVIEAGKDMKDDPLVTDPGTFGVTDLSPLEWGYISTNQTVNGLTQALGVGKVLGGSSSINGMQWTRGTVGQYDALEELGNAGWNFASLQSYMKKSENFHVPNQAQINLGITYVPSAHGHHGNVNTGFPNPYPCPLCKLWDALINATGAVLPNLRTNGSLDQCSGSPQGAARCSYSLLPGPSAGPNAGINVRSSSVRSYIYSLPEQERPNLSILVEHRAIKIIWAEGNVFQPTPRGVAFQAEGVPEATFIAFVDKEVIVSCGTLGSPLFLERSGIGDKKLLSDLNIPVAVDLPAIGRNLQDQAGIVEGFLPSFQLNTTELHVPLAGVSVFATLADILGKKGAQAYLDQLETTVNMRASTIIANSAGVNQGGVEKMLRAQIAQFGGEEAPVVELVYGALPAEGLIGVLVWILLPQYRGTVHISSSDPLSPPIIDPRYITTDLDFSLLVNASIVTREIFAQPAARAVYSTELAPGPSVQTPKQFSEYIRTNYSTTGHFIGSVSMLPKELGGAVDATLSIYGVKAVRVVDASILPLQISAHPSSTVYGIAEKAADLIKQSMRSENGRQFYPSLKINKSFHITWMKL